MLRDVIEANLPNLLEVYNQSPMKSFELLSKQLDSDKHRFVYKVVLENDVVVMKFAESMFEDVNIIEKWASLSNVYQNLGYKTPKFFVTPQGAFSVKFVDSDGVYFDVWCEEFVSSNPMHNPYDHKSIRSDIGKMIGRVATATKDQNVDMPSADIIFGSIDQGNMSDEYVVFMDKVYQLLRHDQLVDQMLLIYIWTEYKQLHKALKPQDCLPTAVFQGDLNHQNMIIDNQQLLGVLDFKRSRIEVVLNYLINAGICEEEKAIHELWLDRAYNKSSDDRFKDIVHEFKKHYTLSESEKSAFPILYKVVRPFKGSFLIGLLKSYKNNDYLEVNCRLKWMANELERDDLNTLLEA